MDILPLVLCLAAAFIARVIAGSYGTGFPVLLAPLAIVVMRIAGVSSLVATHLAFGTAMAAAAITAAWNIGTMSRSGEIDWAAVKYGAIGALIAGAAGALFAGGLQAPALQRVLGIVLAIATLRLFSTSAKGKKESPPEHNPLGMFGVGAATGLATGLTGGAGDTVGALLASAGYGFSQRKAAATAVAVNLTALVAGAVVFVMAGTKNTLVPSGNTGYLNLPGLAAMTAGAAVGAFAAKALVPKISTERSAKVMGVVLLVGAIRLVLFS